MEKTTHLLKTVFLAAGLMGISFYGNAQIESQHSRAVKESGSATTTVSKEKQRSVAQIEANVKDVKAKIEAKQKVEGYNLTALKQRLARLEEELKKAKSEQK